MPTAPRFLRAICRAYSIGIWRITSQTSSCFSNALNNAHKRSRSPSQTYAIEGILVENASPAAIKSSLQVLSSHNSNTSKRFPPSYPKHHLIRWLWPLGRVWAPAIMPLHCFVFCMVVSFGFCTLIHLQYILRFNCAH